MKWSHRVADVSDSWRDAFPVGSVVRQVPDEGQGWLVVVGYDARRAKKYVLCKREDNDYFWCGDDVSGPLYEGFAPTGLRRVE